MEVKHLQDDLALKSAGSLAGELLQRNRTVEIDVRGHQIGIAWLQVGGDNILAAQDHIPLDQVLQFADVSRPVVFLQYLHQLSRERTRFAVVLPVVELQKVLGKSLDIAA